MGAEHRPLRGGAEGELPADTAKENRRFPSGSATNLGSAVAMVGYSTLLGCGLLLSAPWWLARMATSGRYREGLGERLGRVPRRLREAVAGRRVVWVHAVSVGEVLAVARLARELEAALNANLDDRTTEMSGGRSEHPMGSGEDGPWLVVISTTTRTGQALARERFGAERVFYLPLDCAWAVRAYLRVLRPALVVLAESEIWPRLLYECGLREIPVAVVNARVSDRSFRRARPVRAVWGPVLRRVTLWLAQSDADARRLVDLGVAAESVQVSGNLKFDVRAPQQSAIAGMIQRAAGDRKILVAGSTVSGLRKDDVSEDVLLLRVWQKRLRDEGVLLVLAPRHPENFSLVLSLGSEFTTLRASGLMANPEQLSARHAGGMRPAVEVIVLDTIGDLAAVYGVADVAFVGGSLVQRGGHNPLEPAQFGVPVVMGPSCENFRGIVRKMRDAEAICIAADEDELEVTLVRLLHDGPAAQQIGEAGRRVFESKGGATARSVEALRSVIVGVSAAETRAMVTA